MHLVFTHVRGESYCRRLRSLFLYLCYVFQALINSLCVDSFSFVLNYRAQTDCSVCDLFAVDR